MLDTFLEVAYKHETEKTANRQLVEDLKKLPLEELIGLANGEPSEALKIAFASYPSAGGMECWLDKFKGTPLFERACQLEEQLLEIEAKETEARMQQPMMDEFWRARDQICLQKRMLDLEYVKAQAASAAPAGGPQELEAVEGAGLDMAQQAHKTEQAQQGKVAKVLTEGAREHIAPKNFAVSAKQSDTGKPAYPIEDKAHARAALGLVGMHGSPAEKAEVRKDVARKYPGMEGKDKESSSDNAQGAGALGSYETNPKDNAPFSAKQAMEAKIAFATEMGRKLAQSEKKKDAGFDLVSDGAPENKSTNVKQALDLTGVLSAGKGLLGKGVQLAAQHPKAVLPALGAAGGAALGAASSQPGHRMSGALAGGALGAAGGAAGNKWMPQAAQGAQQMIAGLAR